MNILFLTLIPIKNLEERGIYHELMKKFKDEGHAVTIVSPIERGADGKAGIERHPGVTFLRVKTFKIQKSNLLEKGLATLLIQRQYKQAINRYLTDDKYDLIIYSTPPITFASVIETMKRRHKAKTYLLLKDIFPQNAVDLKLIRENGFLHKYFLIKEKRLYGISDHIGCMSPANVNYLIKHYPKFNVKTEVNPNSIEPQLKQIDSEQFHLLREELGLPTDKTIFIYGGNLGKPQGLDFLMETLLQTKSMERAYFVIIGSGTEFEKLFGFIRKNEFNHVLIKSFMKKEDFEKYLLVSDIGMIFLNSSFTIPNFPSRLLDYLEKAKPVICATDLNTDIGKIAEKNNFGYQCANGDLEKFIYYINLYINNRELRKKHGENGLKYLLDNYTVKQSYKKIMDHFI